MRLSVLLCAVLLFPGMVAAATVTDGTITTGITDRQPFDQVSVLPAGETRLYCFTRVQDAGPEGFVVHTWYWGDREMARVKLPVHSADWRTWSSKNILPQWHGDWRVEVADVEGHQLQTLTFQVP